MKKAILYTSSHGTTAKIAAILAEKLGNENVDLIDLGRSDIPEIEGYSQIILGTSIHAGQPSRKMQKFCASYSKSLLSKPLALYVCGMEADPEKRKQEFNTAFSEDFRNHASASGFLGGEFLFEKMNFFEKFIIKKISKTDKSVSSIDYPNIELFVTNLN